MANKFINRINRMKISGVYQIINTITGDFYIGSSIDLKRRKREHFKKNTWKKNQINLSINI